VPAEGDVGFPTDSEHLAVCYAERLQGGPREEGEEPVHDEAHHRSLGPRLLLRQGRDEVGPLQRIEERAQGALFPEDVGVGEDEDLPLRRLGELPGRPVLAAPADGEGCSRQKAKGGVSLRGRAHEVGGAVLGEIVEDQDLERPLAEESR